MMTQSPSNQPEEPTQPEAAAEPPFEQPATTEAAAVAEPSAPPAPAMPAEQLAPPTPQAPSYAPPPQSFGTPHGTAPEAYAPPTAPATPQGYTPVHTAPSTHQGYAAPAAPNAAAPMPPAPPAQAAPPAAGVAQPPAPTAPNGYNTQPSIGGTPAAYSGPPPAANATPAAYSGQSNSYNTGAQAGYSSTQQQFGPAPAGAARGAGGYFDGAYSADELGRPLYGATFGQAFSRFFKNYARFSGRASLSEYWWTQLWLFIGSAILSLLCVVMLLPAASVISDNPGAGLAMMFITIIILCVAGLAVLVPSIALAWRRLHDANLAGPFFFLCLVPYAGSIILIVLTLLPSKAEGRRFDLAERSPM